MLGSYTEAEFSDTSGLDIYLYKNTAKDASYYTNPDCESFQQLLIDDRSVLEWGVSAPQSRGMVMQ